MNVTDRVGGTSQPASYLFRWYILIRPNIELSRFRTRFGFAWMDVLELRRQVEVADFARGHALVDAGRAGLKMKIILGGIRHARLSRRLEQQIAGSVSLGTVGQRNVADAQVVADDRDKILPVHSPRERSKSSDGGSRKASCY